MTSTPHDAVGQALVPADRPGSQRPAALGTDAYMTRAPLLAGANPYLTLYADDAPTVYVSLWRVDWSVRGSGNVMVCWLDGSLRILTDNPGLGGWLEEHFVRRFDEATALPEWPVAAIERTATQIRVDPATGAYAAAADIVVRIDTVLDARPVGISDFPLGGVRHGLSMLLLPCASATVTVGGVEVPGRPRLWRAEDGRPYSSAVTTVHETWCG